MEQFGQNEHQTIEICRHRTITSEIERIEPIEPIEQIEPIEPIEQINIPEQSR